MSARSTIGLTGDVGSGKSTVRQWLAEQGAATLDADALVHQLLASDPAIIDAVSRQFGPAVRGDGGIDRAALAAIVFRDPAALARLEGIVHPAVIEQALAWLARVSGRLAVVEAVKLVESGLHRHCDVVWLVVCDAVTRRERLLERGWSAEEVANRMAAAAPLAPRLAVADAVIDNSGPVQATVRQLEVALSRLECRGSASDRRGSPALRQAASGGGLPGGGPLWPRC